MKHCMKIFNIFIVLIAVYFSTNLTAQASEVIQSFKFKSLEAVDTNVTSRSYTAEVSPISQFTDQEGNYYVAYDGEEYFYIAKLKKSTMKLENTLTIHKPYPLLGGVIQDNQGYFYALFGQEDEIGDGESITVSVIQYDQNGNKIKELALKGNEASNLIGELEYGTKTLSLCEDYLY